MEGIDVVKKIMLAEFFLFMLVGDIWRKPLIELTKLAKISYKVFIYGVIPDPFLDLRSCKMEQMKGIDAMKNKCLVAISLFLPMGDIWRKLLI